MRFAVSLLSVLGIASVVGTVLQQGQAMTDYAFKFGPFWYEIFKFLGLYDVYASAWFVLIMLFLVISTSLCLLRNAPPFLKEMRSYRIKATEKSLKSMKHSVVLEGALDPEVAKQYLTVEGFRYKVKEQDNGDILIAAKKGSASKLGYIFAHAALIVICLGGLIDSNMVLKLGMLTGRLVPDPDTLLASEFKPKSRIGSDALSFRGDVMLPEGGSANVVFLNADKGYFVQELPFTVKLNKFYVDYYNTGMPKNFASDIVVTENDNGKVHEATIRVNHPLTVQGITIYQSSFGDGGSKLNFRAWDLKRPESGPAQLNATSMNAFPLDMGDQKYSIEFAEFSMINVEDFSQKDPNDRSFGEKVKDVRAVTKEKTMANIGPSITYKIRDAAGQAQEYMQYMEPISQEGTRYFVLGERTVVSEPYNWLRLPADGDDSINTFMNFRRSMADPAQLNRAIERATSKVEPHMRAQFTMAVRNVMRLFTDNGGYLGIDEFVKKNIPTEQQQDMGALFVSILHGVSADLLDISMQDQGQAAWPNDASRSQFVVNALVGLTALQEIQSPVYMQLENFEQLQSSGLQLTRSPGQFWVYVGSVLLIFGTIFMFYVREKRLWLWFGQDGVRMAMSATRHARDLDIECPEHAAKLNQLAKDLTHDQAK
ncbi:MAG: cytochrome c biogenesis protein ResB [Neisseriaceae bacterium]|nr:cytochrome c biogenesis protein ResB [Neisseriaceae bacterium]